MNNPKTAVVTANLGGMDAIFEYAPQSVEYDLYRLTDKNFPPRSRSMTPRMQARIAKCFMWQMFPGYEYYIWVDGSCSLLHRDSIKWFLEQCEGVDMAFFRHPNRATIRQEADFLRKKLAAGSRYICSRYQGEFLDEQMTVIESDDTYRDDLLIASTAFVYKNGKDVQNMMKEWWYHISRYHTIDQLSLPYVIRKSKCRINIINSNYGSTPYMTFTRNIHVN